MSQFPSWEPYCKYKMQSHLHSRKAGRPIGLIKGSDTGGTKVCSPALWKIIGIWHEKVLKVKGKLVWIILTSSRKLIKVQTHSSPHVNTSKWKQILQMQVLNIRCLNANSYEQSWNTHGYRSSISIPLATSLDLTSDLKFIIVAFLFSF